MRTLADIYHSVAFLFWQRKEEAALCQANGSLVRWRACRRRASRHLMAITPLGE